MSDAERTVLPLAERQGRVGWGGGSFELPLCIGRYCLTERIASGGNASVYKGRLDGPVGFARTVAVKRLHPQFAADAEFVARFAAEARLAARIHHANVVQTFDFVEMHGELFLVLEYVEGCTFSALLSRARKMATPLPVSVSTGIVLGALQGLSAAHDLRDADGRLVRLVHRDFSPQNVMVGVDGVARVLDFGIAKVATWNLTRRKEVVAGKLSYMSPEQTSGADVDQRSDLFSAGIVLWEALAGRRLFGGSQLEDGAVLRNVLELTIRPPSEFNAAVSPELDAVVLKALQRDRGRRWPTARQFAAALQDASVAAQHTEISDFLRQSMGLRRQGLPSLEEAVLPTVVASLKGRTNIDKKDDTTFATGSVDLARSSDSRVFERMSVAEGRVRSREWALVGLLAVVVCIGTLLLRDHIGKPNASSVVATAVAPTEPFKPPPPVVFPVEPKKVPTIDTARTIDSLPIAPPVSSASKALPTPKPRAHTKKVVSSAQPAAGCAVPTYTDAEGISHFKAECL